MLAHAQAAEFAGAGADPWRSRAIEGSAYAAALLYRWHRRTAIEPTVRKPMARERATAAIAAVGRALIEDRRMTREAWRLYARRQGERRAFVTLALGGAGARRLPLIEAGPLRVLPLLAGNGTVADLIGWQAGKPDEWSTRTNAFTALLGGAFDAVAARLRLCRHPASWHAAGGEASDAICLLDATDDHWCLTVERAGELVCDDDDHARAVLAWLKDRRPKLPKLFVAGTMT